MRDAGKLTGATVAGIEVIETIKASEAEVFTYNTEESLDAPVYLSVQSYADMDAQTLAEGLALQSGMDGAWKRRTQILVQTA